MTELIIFFLTLGYAALVSLLLFYWLRTPRASKSLTGENTFVTVLVPVRNEAERIERLIHSLLVSGDSLSTFEILIVNDHSTDDTVGRVERLAEANERVRWVDLPKEHEGKKAAITLGVKEARGELILCTDGDSEVGPDWVAFHLASYQRGAGLSFGPVRFFNEKKSRWVDMLGLELTGLVAMGAATLRMRRPTMINGCNYSFAKRVFEEVGGFEGNERVPTGDDEFLLRKVFSSYPGQVAFLKHEGATVTSLEPESMGQFYHQRRRWASKWRFHKESFSRLIPAFLFLCYASWGVLVASAITQQVYLPLGLLAVKCFVDFGYLYHAARGQGQSISLLSFILLQIIYPFYVVFFGVASNFGQYHWRERTYKI